MENNWRQPPAPLNEREIAGEYTADAVIVGLGHAGVCAARAAAEAGSSVIVLEKHSKKRHQFQGGGQIGHINSGFLERMGVPKVDILEYVNDWQLRSNNRSNVGLIFKYAKNSGSCFDWLFDAMPEDYRKMTKVTHHPAGESYGGGANGIRTWVGCACGNSESIDGHMWSQTLMEASLHIAEDKGARVFYDISGDRLTVENGAVTGVIGRDADGKYYRFNADKGVLLSAGDFSGNTEMCLDLLTEYADVLWEQPKTASPFGNDGSGIRMGVWAGGRLEPRPLGSMGGNYFYPCGTPNDPIGTSPVLWLNKYGKRYCNEGFGDAVLAGVPGMRQPRGIITVVFDMSFFEMVGRFPAGHMAFDRHSERECKRLRETMASAMAAGAEGFLAGQMRVYGAETVELLAEYAGYKGEDAEFFAASVRRYNEICREGRDTDFGKDPNLLMPLKTTPYFAYSSEIAPGPMLCTVGGLLTDDDQNVLDKNNEPIPGLYASGNCCGGRFGLQYSTPIPGVSLNIAQTLGREAGKTIAAL